MKKNKQQKKSLNNKGGGGCGGGGSSSGIAARIIGGDVVENANKYPYYALTYGSYYCGSTVIQQRMPMT
jgi:hypothetical protein